MMKGLPVSCFPPLAATERLGEKKAKAVKGNSLCKTPFPFVEVAEFQPAWSAEQVCVCSCVGALASQHMFVCQFVVFRPRHPWTLLVRKLRKPRPSAWTLCAGWLPTSATPWQLK